MGKSMACLNIIACGKKDGVDRADLEVHENKVSSDRRGWSFRKKSVNKQSLESDVVNFQTMSELSVQEKTSSVQMEAKTDLPSQLDTDLSLDFPKEDNADETDVTIDELGVIKIQASVRGFLARRLLSKQNSVIKIQAAVRRHLARRQAIGTLRCVQAIIKIQGLFRARACRESSGKVRKENNKNVEKLLSNAFAHQLMASTQKTSSIRIKCEPFKSDSAWKWLERWTLASSVRNEEKGLGLIRSMDLVSGKNIQSVNESEKDDDLISYKGSGLESTCVEPKLDPISIEEKNLKSKVVMEPYFTKRKGADTELYMPDCKRSSIEQPHDETELKKSYSRKEKNPAFIAAQMKFEELSSSAKISTTFSSSGNEGGVRSALDRVPSYTDLQVNGSECGTELSISSTLDSPDRSVPTIVNDNEVKPKDSDKTNPLARKEHGEIKAKGNEEHLQTEEIENPILPVADASYPDSDKSDKYEIVDSSAVESVEEKPEISHVACNDTAVSEPQGRPSSQVSVKPKKPKSSLSSGDKKTPLSRNIDSASSKNSSERDNKARKRRNSFESNKSDHKEQEPRDSVSSSSISLPSYMQATKSARAKAMTNGLPRFSPEVLDKDAHDVRKRHSMPYAAHERQGSPMIQRSLSQAQQNVKGNATQSPQDRRWRR